MIWSLLRRNSLDTQKLGIKVSAVQRTFLVFWIKEYAVRGTIFFFLSIIALTTPMADEINTLTCPQKYLAGEAAQEMMVKGVIMHTTLQSEEKELHTEHTFVHTVRADWTIWICIQVVDANNGKPNNLRLSCTACEY
tara:strand:- start:412 stop:822 length:411 start_codon:yes stop_codon:yes gene_type:complete